MKKPINLRTALRVGWPIWLFGCSLALAQTPSPSSDTNNQQALVQRIRKGDTQAIAEAATSSDKVFVPYLRQAMKSTSGPDLKKAARLALAELGEAKELQEQWCLVLSSYPEMADLGKVGGWYAIRGLALFLGPEGLKLVRPASPKQATKATDVSYPPPSYIAIKTLSSLVPDPPARFDATLGPPELDKVAQVWRDWIAAHRDELSRLQPTGEGVDFSPNACKNGKPRKKHN